MIDTVLVAFAAVYMAGKLAVSVIRELARVGWVGCWERIHGVSYPFPRGPRG